MVALAVTKIAVGNGVPAPTFLGSPPLVLKAWHGRPRPYCWLWSKSRARRPNHRISGEPIFDRPNETLAALGTSPYAPAPQRRTRLADVLVPVKVVKRFPISGRGGIGRHAGLRSLCPQRAWRFNSSRPHSTLSLAGSQSSELAEVLWLQV